MPTAAPLAPAATAAARAYLPALTGIRAVAAYMVCLHHFNPFAEGPGLGGFLHNLLLEFHVGVPVFFVLSGFLICLRYYGTEQWTGRWWGRYLRNRVARIYPMFLLLTTLTFAPAWLAHAPDTTRLWLLNVTFLRGFFDAHKYSGIPQGWTLTVEECFYLWAPVAFGLLRRRPRLLWLQPLGLLALGCALVLGLGPLAYEGLFGSFRFMLLYTFFGRAVEFYAGMQLALWYRRGLLRAPRGPRGLYTAAGLGLLLAAVLALVAVRGQYPYGQEAPAGIALNNVALPAGIVLLFAGLLTEATWLRALLASAPLQLLGRSSYVFYLIHFGTIKGWLRDYVTASPAGQFVLLNVLAIGLYYLVEQPLNRLLRAPSAAEPAN
ncbi:acyltransferase [Hymenobacter gummosus]|uniref:Acyltransferase n=1 Tax=Hymenobacter gummosus TaxID=1776032 RepID=A0A431TX41_9BACT|nr:acyltransferase [Hymenobacter gummosus]RTQ46539.1 acyltransferase [Hymenobacter gummosus]